jgi:hypothetical protein
MSRASNDAREDGTRRIVSGESGFAHSGAIINDQSGNFFVTHFRFLINLFNRTIDSKINSFEQANLSRASANDRFQ